MAAVHVKKRMQDESLAVDEISCVSSARSLTVYMCVS